MRGPRRKARSPSSSRSGATDAAAHSARNPGREPLADQAPVLAPQRDKVGDGRKGDQVEVALGLLDPEQGGGELVGDAGRAELAERIAAEARVKDRAVGKGWPRLVMVGDDHVHSGRPGGGDLVRAGDPAVDGDQETRSSRGEPINPIARQPIAIAHPIGDEPVAAGTELAQGPHDDRRRGYPVAVVVAMNRDRAPVGDRPRDRRGDVAHRVERERIVSLGRVQECASVDDRPISAPNERHGDRLRQVQRLHQGAGIGVGKRLEREGLARDPGSRRLTSHDARLRTGGDGTLPWSRLSRYSNQLRRLRRLTCCCGDEVAAGQSAARRSRRAPITVPGTATRTVPKSVSPIERPDAIWTIAPEIMPPAIAPRSAPTIPAQNRSGMNTVKCHSAIATVNQTTAAISAPLHSSMPPVLAPSPLLALAPLLALLLGLLLGPVALRGRPHGLAFRWGLGTVAA